MLKLHKVYQEEETELSSILTLARTTHPELLIQFPQLALESKGKIIFWSNNLASYSNLIWLEQM